MAPGVCVTSFRMFMRRSDFSHLSRGLRLTPVGTLTVNSWHLMGRSYCTDQVKEIDTGKNNVKKASQSAEPGSNETANSLSDLPNKASNLNQITCKAPDLSQMKVADLKAQLRHYDLSTSGKRQVLLERLQNFMQQKDEQAQSTTNAQDADTAAVTEATLAVESPAVLLVPPPTTPQISTQIHNSSTSASSSSEENARTTVITCTPFEDDTHSTAANNAKPPNYSRTHGDVSVEYIQGLPHITVPLPSRNEKCRFALKPVSHKVGDLIDMLKEEDRGIDRATVLNHCGVRIASTCNIESLMDEPFWLQINDQKYKVCPPEREKVGSQDFRKLSDIRALIAQLYEALNVGEYHIAKEQELASTLENLKYELAPLERKKSELHNQAERKIHIMTWVGLGLMSVQFGILARLTWWEYSWDIMEPVTYFVTYGTTMGMYAYYCMTKMEYHMPDVKDREYLLTMYKRAKKKNFDIENYNRLKQQIAELEFDLRRLRDPLNLQLPPHVNRAQQGPSAAQPLNPDDTPPDTGKKPWLKLPFLESKKE